MRIPETSRTSNIDTLLAEMLNGRSISAAERLAGFTQGTVRNWARRKVGAQLSLVQLEITVALKERRRNSVLKRERAPKWEMSVALEERKLQPTKAKATCVHHFDIGKEHDNTSSGRCRKCGLIRVFHNEPSHSGVSWGWNKDSRSAEEQESALNAAREEWSFDGESTTTVP